MNPWPDHNPHPDLRLVRSSLVGDSDASRELGERLGCIPRILAAINGRMGSPQSIDEVLDLSQEVTLVVWRRRESFTGKAALETWVFGYCRIEMLRSLGKRRRRRDQDSAVRQQYVEDNREREAQSAVQPQGLDVCDATAGGALERLLKHLSRREREVATLRHADQLEFQDIASQLCISVSSAKTHYYRSLRKLRDVVETARAASERGQND